jgi:anti-sigma regulatory factor (Ser/Thr protein kinase)
MNDAAYTTGGNRLTSLASTVLTRSFTARLDQCAAAAAFVESAAAALDPVLARKLRLALEELFVNTVTHGHGGDSDAAIGVTVAVAGDRLVLTYADAAPPYNPFAVVEPPEGEGDVDARAVGHLGLFLITRLAVRCDYAREAGQNRITVELRAPGSPEPA